MDLIKAYALYFFVGIAACSVWAIAYPYFPKIKLFSLEIFPSIRIRVGSTTIHFHHWFYYPIILVVSFIVDGGILTTAPVRGYLLGAIVKEAFFPHRKNIVPRKLVYKAGIN